MLPIYFFFGKEKCEPFFVKKQTLKLTKYTRTCSFNYCRHLTWLKSIQMVGNFDV